MTSATSNQTPHQTSRYISGEWSHIFGNGQGETGTRILLDADTQKLIRLDVQASRAIHDSYRAGSDDELADVQDSLVNANAELFDNPADFGLDLTYALPAWATGGFLPKQIVFYKPDPSNMGPIVLTEVGAKIHGYCVQRDMTLSYYVGDLYTPGDLAQELEKLIFEQDEVMFRREKIVGRLEALKAAALLSA